MALHDVTAHLQKKPGIKLAVYDDQRHLLTLVFDHDSRVSFWKTDFPTGGPLADVNEPSDAKAHAAYHETIEHQFGNIPFAHGKKAKWSMGDHVHATVPAPHGDTSPAHSLLTNKYTDGKGMRALEKLFPHG